MPVHCELRSGKHRIIEPGGEIATNKSGTALDGGGHSTSSACQSQARAINAKVEASMDFAKWPAKYVNDLPNSAFLYVEPGGKKDADGKTVPRSKRHFPYKDKNGKVDLPHLRNAIARIPQSNAPGLTVEKKRALQERGRKMLDKIKKAASRAVLAREGLSAFTFASSDSVDTEGVRRKSFKKDMMSVGTYRHPFFEWEMSVTVDRMQKWVDTFKLMRENGIDIPITVNHSHAAEDLKGYITDLFIESDTLFGIHEFRGDEAIELASVVKNVSILIEPDYIDGKGRHYGEALLHSSLEQDPIVPDQDEFVPIAASRNDTDASVPRFVLSTHSSLSKETDMTIDKEKLEEIRKQLSLTDEDELTEENAVELMFSAITSRDSEIAELTSKSEELETAIAASRDKSQPKIDPDITDQQAELAEEKLSMLVDKGKIIPAVAQSLTRILIGDKAARKAYCLSRRMSKTDDSIARGVIAALDENDIVLLAGQRETARTLSRQVPGEEDPKVDENTQKEMIEAGSVG